MASREPSPQKNTTPVSSDSEPEEVKPKHETIYERKKPHPLLSGPSSFNRRDYAAKYRQKTKNTEFKQRIKSAKVLKVKQLQNQLGEAEIKIDELTRENKLLQSVQKRQELALKKYEGNKGELPQLLKTHNDDVRVLKTSLRSLKLQMKDTLAKIKEKDGEVEVLKESNTKLKKIVSEKNLLEREELQKKLEEAKKTMTQQEEQLQMMSRKMMLESKNFRHQLNAEIGKHKESSRQLTSALEALAKLEGCLSVRDRSQCLSPNLELKISKQKIKNAMFRGAGDSDDIEVIGDRREILRVKQKGIGDLLTPIETLDNALQQNDMFLDQLDTGEKGRKLVRLGRTSPQQAILALKEAEAANRKLADTIDKGLEMITPEDATKGRLKELYKEIRSNVCDLDKKLEEDLNKSKSGSSERSGSSSGKPKYLTKSTTDVRRNPKNKTQITAKVKKVFDSSSESENEDNGVKEQIATYRKRSEKEVDATQEPNIPSLTDVSLIMGELKKADNAFKKLASENPRVSIKKELFTNPTKTATKVPNKRSYQEAERTFQTYKTNSINNGKVIESLNNEEQKQSLLKSLKAIDHGDSSEDGEVLSRDTEDVLDQNVECTPSGGEHLMEQLFGHK